MIKVVKVKKIVIFVIIFLIVFLILYYKNCLFGNNINRNRIDDILNEFNNYTAELSVIVKSNKTENSYVIKQMVKDNYCMQEVLEGENIRGLKIELENKNLKVSSTNLKLDKIYSNYNDLMNNAFFLNVFCEDYKNSDNTTKYIEKDEEIIIETNLCKNKNTYIKNKKLYINKETKLPVKLEIKGDSQNKTICILYNNIEINKI